ncbi:hypothetical protein NIGALANA_21 [Bacillus phage Nigalana]|uniref:Uncharacterized protein n=2 Tax=Wphvirus megatron TaxID=1987728 RepID=A0A1B1PBJ2_9CAUD|nr:hypothetical protein QLX47_gp023 [Bacillus phage Eyuki]YP_009282413.1 hypothetical protein BI005_gp021 [Bacillus phage Nigalana]YP_009284963.1 hypothetical protein BIZ88_gp021 [Bacillus phage DirtyBetty]YP_009286897.1 hypothetical protein BI006_gp021 [Bacillus phage Nemo]AOZ62268.1 hypothetical protein SBP8a_18 [Bacillus phage SBP8a]ASR78633.1 hypothetical protein BUBS_21 [Bacillus phage Bubs]ASR79334.1 hypothetical protein ZAINNY_21 [Bacillus phage Zainny]AXQ67575.1 hypothetical protein 
MKTTHVKKLILDEFEVGATYDICVQDKFTGGTIDMLDVVVHQAFDDYIHVQYMTGKFANVYWFDINFFTYKGVNSGVVH